MLVVGLYFGFGTLAIAADAAPAAGRSVATLAMAAGWFTRAAAGGWKLRARARRARRDARVRLGHCAACDYDLTGNVSGVCPECGTRVLAPSP